MIHCTTLRSSFLFQPQYAIYLEKITIIFKNVLPCIYVKRFLNGLIVCMTYKIAKTLDTMIVRIPLHTIAM